MEVIRVEKPWGYELIFAKTKSYVGKILHINKGHKLSLQFHNQKEETVFVSTGIVNVQIKNDKNEFVDNILNPGESYHILPKLIHRFIAIEECDLFEVSTPHLDDIVRLEDSYGRVSNSL